MFDHVEMKVADFAKSTAFYKAALEALGIKMLLKTKGMSGWGTGLVVGGDGEPRVEFLIEGGDAEKPPLHVAFKAKTRDAVDKFYAAAMAAGGRDNGAPGLRQDYHPKYYAAFVIDPDGHNVEAVCHT